MATQGSGRRAGYTAATRQAILAAARQLFVERGYFGTRVEDIGRAARVTVPTVYATGGGGGGKKRLTAHARRGWRARGGSPAASTTTSRPRPTQSHCCG
ncbi:TetR/AcrR family transcriptional regulator [Streptomyces vinaceus]|uniref:TetR/AcrR family transcriptional regulator n=1 Tax=Streptomyces vinaceus TaxID=1960 RepID=UPI0035D59E05